jgi:glycosyltransferase involved in cell wall biosynthesis
VRIAYVLPRPELGGGNKVVFQHAHLLRDLGDEVTILGEGERPDWIELRLPYHDYRSGRPELPPQDLVIATFWTTLRTAMALRLGPVAHFCQGYEGDLEHLWPVAAEIERTYALPLPTLTVSPHLGDFLRARFGRDSVVAPPPLDPEFRPAWRWRPSRRPWIVVPGVFAAEVKGVRTALAAVLRLRERGLRCRLLRVSTLPPCAVERGVLEADRYLHAVRPAAVAAALRRCDLLLLSSRAGEGFGLPLLEAMASGVPAVASRIPSVEDMTRGAVALVAADDPAAFAAPAAELLTHARQWRRARRRGRAAARRFRPQVVGPVVHAAVRWAAARAVDPAPRLVPAGC